MPLNLIPKKSYKKGVVFFKETTLIDIANHSLMLTKVFSKWPIPLKANV